MVCNIHIVFTLKKKKKKLHLKACFSGSICEVKVKMNPVCYL